MSNAWDQAADMADKHASQGGIFVKLADDGDKIVGAFCGDPHAREVVWTGEGYEAYDEKNPDHKGKRPSLKVLLNFYVPADGTMKVIELNNTTFRDLLKIRDKYGLASWVFEVERSGKARDPKTKYSILPEHQIDASLRAQIEAADLHDLASFASGDDDGEAQDGPIAEFAAEQLMASLRRLPRSAVDTFLSEMKVQRIRDVRASEVGRAHDLIARLEAKHAPKPQAEVDPFA